MLPHGSRSSFLHPHRVGEVGETVAIGRGLLCPAAPGRPQRIEHTLKRVPAFAPAHCRAGGQSEQLGGVGEIAVAARRDAIGPDYQLRRRNVLGDVLWLPSVLALQQIERARPDRR